MNSSDITSQKTFNDPRILFILGAGASADSGLGTFRGPSGKMPINSKEFYSKFVDEISMYSPGETYLL